MFADYAGAIFVFFFQLPWWAYLIAAVVIGGFLRWISQPEKEKPPVIVITDSRLLPLLGVKNATPFAEAYRLIHGRSMDEETIERVRKIIDKIHIDQ